MNKLVKIPKSLSYIDLQPVLRRSGIYTQQRLNKETKEQLKSIAKQMLKRKDKASKPQRHVQFSDEIVLAYWQKQIRIVEVLEKKLETKLEQFIDSIVRDFLIRLEEEIPNQKKLKGYFDDNEEELLVRAQLDFTPLLMNQAVLSGQEAYRLIHVDEVYVPHSMHDAVVANVTRFTKSMIDTDRDKLIGIIEYGLDDGKSVPEIRSAILGDFEGEFSRMQAQRITRTEVLRASNQAALDAYKQSGVVEAKQWLTAGAVDECAEYEGQIETLNGNFYSDTDQFRDGDPPLHPNCRCVVLPIVVDEKAYKPPINQGLVQRIAELESQVDKRTKAYKELHKLKADDTVYIKSLEKHLGINDE